MVQEIAVDGKAVLGLAGLRPFRHNVQRTVPLLQENDVRYNLSPRIGLERIVGQTDGPQQIGALGQIPAHGGILGIHRIAAGDKSHHAAGTHLVQRLGEKVVVDVEIQLVIGFVPDLILAERHIAHRQIVEVPPVGGLKSGHGDVRLGIKLPSNPPADGIQLHAIQTAVLHFLRQHTEEVAHTAGRLQDVASLKSHAAHGFIDGSDHRGAGVVGVEGRPSDGSVFLRGQQLLQLGIFLAPAFLVRVKSIRQPAPAHIPGEDLLLLRRCLPGGSLQVFQQLDRLDVGLELSLGTAFAQVIVRDTEILGGAAQVLLVLPISGFLGSPGIGEGLPLAIDLDGNGMFVQHFIQGLFRFDGRCGRLRFIGPQGLNHHIIGQMVLVARIDSHRLGVISRGFGSRFRAFLSKTVQLTGIQPAQQRRNFVPAEKQHGQPLFLCVQHFQLDTFRHCAVVGGVAGLQLHRFHNVGIGPAQPQGNLPVALAVVQQLGKLRLVRLTDQAMCQHIPQVLVHRIRVCRKKLGIEVVAVICPKKLLKLFLTLGPVDGIAHARGQQLHRVIPQLCDLVSAVIQIDNIPHMVGRDCWIIRSPLPDRATGRSIFLV